MKIKKIIILATIIFSLMLLIVSCINPTKDFTLEEAKQKVIDDVISNASYLNVIMFGKTSPFAKDTTITELFRSADDEIKLTEESYIFWVDYFPGARYTHNSEIVVISRKTGYIKKYDWKFWPAINGVDYWKDRSEYWDESQWRYSYFVSPVKPINLSPDYSFSLEGINYRETSLGSGTGEAAIVVRGDDEDGFLADENHMKDFYEDQDIPVTAIHPTDGASGVIDAINNLKESPDADDISIYITGHGGKEDNGDRFVAIGNTKLSASRLKQALTPPATKTFKVIIDACYSGGFISYLDDLLNVVCVHTAAASDQYSYSDWDPTGAGTLTADPNASDTGGEWTSGFYEDLEILVNDVEQMILIELEAIMYDVPVIAVLYDKAKDSAKDKDAAYLNGLTSPQDFNNYPLF